MSEDKMYPFETEKSATFSKSFCRVQARTVDRVDRQAQIELTITDVSKGSGRRTQKFFSLALTRAEAEALAKAITEPLPQ